MPAAGRPSQPTDIVGRDLEWAVVAAFIVDASRSLNGAGALLIGGEAGLGKSMVWRAAVTHADALGLQVLACSPAAVERSFSYVALRDLLAPIPEATLERLPPPQRDALGGALLRLPAEASIDQGAIGMALTVLLRRWAQERPLLIAIDDTQWLDPPSARAISFAIRRLADAPVSVLLTRRTGEPAPLFEEVAAHLGDAARDLRLGPVSFGALHRILTTRTAHRFARPIVARIESSSGGNPMTAIEIGRALLESGATDLGPGHDLPVPERLRDLLDARLGRLGPASQESLLLASALSHPTVSVIAAAAEDPLASTTGLEEAEAAGIVEIDEGAVRFTHPLFASVVQSRTSVSRRRSIHARLGGAVADDEARVYHLALAATAPDPVLADRLEATGRRTYHRGAPDLGAGLLRRARELTPTDDLDARARRLILEAEAWLEAGDLAGSRDLLEGAATWLPAGTRRAEARLLLGTVEWYLEPARARPTLEQALADATGDDSLRGRIHGRLALFADDIPTSRANGRAAVRLIDPTLDPSGLAFAQFNLFFAEVRGGAAPDLAMFDSALVLEAGLPLWEVSTIPGLWWKYAGDLDRARARLELHLAWARDSGDASSDAELFAHIAELEVVAGRWSAADTAADRSVEAAEQMGQSPPHTSDRVRALVDVHIGRIDQAVAAAEVGVDACRGVDPELEAMYLDVLGAASSARQDHAGTIAALDRLTVLLDSLGVVEPLRFRNEGDHIEALLATGATDRARVLIERLEHRHATIPRAWLAATLIRAQALVHVSSGDLSSATSTLTAGIDALSAPGAEGEPFAIARLYLLRGQVERRRGRRRLAGASLNEATQRFDALPAPSWAAVARAELERLGRRGTDGRNLTAAEARVVELIATGMTNRAVAERLVLSPKTIEAHLARAYDKLGIRSRAELGRHVASTPTSALDDGTDRVL